MDYRCPKCKYDLSNKFLKSKLIDCGHKRSKVPIPFCPSCKTLLVRKREEVDKPLLITIGSGLFALMLAKQFFSEYIMYVGVAFIFVVSGVSVYFYLNQKDATIWKIFDGNERTPRNHL